MLRVDSEMDCAAFRLALTGRILEHVEIQILSDDQRTALFEALDRPGEKIIEPQSSDIQPRLRSLRKAASDARRFAQSLKLVDELDVENFDHGSDESIKISSQIKALDATADRLEIVINEILEKSKRTPIIVRFFKALHAFPLLNTLALYNIPPSTRNDFTSRGTGVKDVDKNVFLPDLTANTTLAMKCVMLNLFSLNISKLDWSTTITMIEYGKDFSKQVAHNDAIGRQLRELASPLVESLHRAMARTVDSIGFEPDETLVQEQEEEFRLMQLLPDFKSLEQKPRQYH